MEKIANAQELAAELKKLIAATEQPNPSRQKLAADMRSLAERVGGGLVVGPRGLERPGGSDVTFQEGAAYYLGASSSPKFIILTKVTDDTVKYKQYPFTGKEYTLQRWIAADLIEKGTKTQLSRYGKHMDPGLKASMESLLRGGRGRREKMEDYQPVSVELAPADDLKGQDLWYAAEEYGGVGGIERDGVMHYEVDTEKRNVEKMKNDRRFKVVKVKKR